VCVCVFVCVCVCLFATVFAFAIHAAVVFMLLKQSALKQLLLQPCVA